MSYINIPSEGIFEVGVIQDKKEIRIIYQNEECANKAKMKMFNEQSKELKELFPNGIL